uniref:Poly [ADP-ribose] polymerase n=1 Tax=Gouania willdenowi TaxID=441366 RepID=A0A8C5HA54_GOUWI
MYVSILKSETNCLVELVNDTQTSQDDSKFQQGPKPLYQLQTPDGVDIVVCKADLCTYPIDAVVSSSSPDLKHKGGLAGALSKAAGPQLQDECDKIIQTQGQLKPGDSVITNAGGRLCCKRVIHAVAPTFEPAKPAKALAQLKRAVKGSLELAEADGCVSVALPAISKGLGFPLPLCAITIVKAVKEHCDEKCDDGTLRRIDFVNNDDATVQAIKSVIRQEFGNYGVSPSHEDHSSHGKPAGFDQDLYHGQTKEGVNITLAKGCIENATTDVIVNILASDLSLNKGAVSNAILHVAGSKLQDLVKASKSSGHVGEIIVTDACKLRCKQVYHAIAPHYNKGNSKSEKELRKIISDCLNRVENDALTSITFPAIGTGNLGFPRDQAVTLMYEEILAFSSKKMYIRVSGRLHFGVSSSAGYFSQVVSSPGMYETKMGSVTIQVAKGDITKETTDVIVNSSNDTFTLKSGVSKAILEAAGQAVEAECQKLGADKTTGMMMTQGGNLSCKKILHLVGQTDPQKINNAVKDALQMCLSNSFTSVSFPALGTGQGQVKAKQVADVMLDAVISVLSKNTSGTLTTLRIVIFQEPMLNDFYSSMQERQITVCPNRVVSLSLLDEEMPGHWEPMKDNTKSHSVTLNPGTAEHTEILSLFQATCTRPVTKIERIQNPVLWKSLMIKKRHMEEMNGHQNNERRLFHGTCQTTVATINEHGFNRSFAGKNAANYGNGSYFAVNANYSAQDTYSKPNATGDKFMYVCRVLTGDFTLGKVNMLVPPSKGAQSVQMYDSVVDNMTTPHMFIIFHDSHAYPEYLISFK